MFNPRKLGAGFSIGKRSGHSRSGGRRAGGAGWLVLLSTALLVAALSWLIAPGLESQPAVAAQSTGDSLPTRTPTPTSPPQPAATFTPTSPPTRMVWVGRIVSATPDATQGQGSIFRVSVEGMPGAVIELRSDDQLITGEAGSKPEYGPYAAEFAPVTAGVWTVSVPALGAGIDVSADNFNLVVIEFVQIPEAEATQAALPKPSPTALDGQVWEGRVAGETVGIGTPFSRLLVQVTGRNAQPVRLATYTEVINTAITGQKPDELGSDVVEFAGLTPGRYIVEPLGLNSSIEVELKANTETRVEFVAQAPPPTATFTPIPPPATATPLPLPPTPTSPPTAAPLPTDTPAPPPTPTPVDTPTPVPTAKPVKHWLGRVAAREKMEDETSAITVRVSGIEGLSVRLRDLSGSAGLERRCVTGQGGAGQDVCTFENLAPGRYTVAPEGLGVSLPVMLYEQEQVTALFALETLPPGITGWQARLVRNSNESKATVRAESTITVRIAGRPGQVAALRSARGTEQFCEVEANPVLGGLACEFGELGPGVYLVEALHTGAGLRLFVDGAGRAEVEFSPNATYATQALDQLPPVVGQGAQPREAETPTPAAQVSAAVTVPAALPTATPTVTPTPTPILAWQARIVEVTNDVAGAIGVRVLGLKDHPVILHSGNWQSPPQLTGAKAELGDYAVEFGGLAQGTYTVELVGLAEFSLDLGANQFVLVEFRYDTVASP